MLYWGIQQILVISLFATNLKTEEDVGGGGGGGENGDDDGKGGVGGGRGVVGTRGSSSGLIFEMKMELTVFTFLLFFWPFSF